MATGYNARSLEELADEYSGYKSNDWENSDDDTMTSTWKNMTIDQKIDFIRDDEFEIESSDTAFDESEIH